MSGEGSEPVSFLLGGTAPEPRVRGRRRIAVAAEVEKKDWLRGVAPTPGAPLGRAGDGGNTRFGAGFFRRTGLEAHVRDSAAERERAQEERLARRIAVRQERMCAVERRNGDVVVGDGGGVGATAGGEEKRGRKWISDAPSAQLAKEGVRAMRDTSFRFFREEPARKEPLRDPRAARLGTDAVEPTKKKSTLLGFGDKGDLRSYGARDAFDCSIYDPSLRPLSPQDAEGSAPPLLGVRREGMGREGGDERGVEEGRVKSAKGGGAFAPTLPFTPGSKDDPFAAHLSAHAPRALRKGERAPDNLFSTDTRANLKAAMPDEEARAIRVEKEIKKKLQKQAASGHPHKLPAASSSLLATAVRLEASKAMRKRQEEVQMVRDLP